MTNFVAIRTIIKCRNKIRMLETSKILGLDQATHTQTHTRLTHRSCPSVKLDVVWSLAGCPLACGKEPEAEVSAGALGMDA